MTDTTLDFVPLFCMQFITSTFVFCLCACCSSHPRFCFLFARTFFRRCLAVVSVDGGPSRESMEVRHSHMDRLFVVLLMDGGTCPTVGCFPVSAGQSAWGSKHCRFARRGELTRGGDMVLCRMYFICVLEVSVKEVLGA